MSLISNPGVIASVKAAANLTKRRFIDPAGNHCAADERAIGVSNADVDSGQNAAVIVTGIAVVEAGAAVSVGDHVKSDANGKAITAAVVGGALNPAANGLALEAATADTQLIRVKLF